MARSIAASCFCLQRAVDLVLETWGVPTVHHTDQLHLAEFCAIKIADLVMNIDLVVEARNTAAQAASKHKALHLDVDDDGGAGEPAGAAEVTTAVLVERVQLLAPSDAARVRHVLKQLITVAGQVRGSTRPASPTWSQEESPAKVAKCRQLGRWPTGDSVPESQDVGATP